MKRNGSDSITKGALALMLALIAATAASITELAVGDRSPPLRREFLNGRTAVLPQAAFGRMALLMFGFTHHSRFSVEAWRSGFIRTSHRNPKSFFEIPLIDGMARMGKWLIDSGMRRGTPKADNENVITVYGGTDQWKERVGFRDTRAAYLILLSPNRKVVWRYAGSLDERPYKALSSEVSKLLSAN